MKINVFTICILSLLSSTSIVSADNKMPTLGTVYNTKENSYATYDCKKISDEKISCEFVQVSIRKKAKLEELESRLEKAKKELPDAIKDIATSESCTWVNTMLKILESDSSPEKLLEELPKGFITDKNEFLKGVKETTPFEKKDNAATFRDIENFCKKKDETSYLQIVRREHERQMRTCVVSSNAFKQELKWVSDDSGVGVWVVDSSPNGPCGIVQLSKFESDKSDSKFVFWKYIAKKIVTNPNGETGIPNLTCKGYHDESEYVYDWKEKKDRNLNCDYINFSPF